MTKNNTVILRILVIGCTNPLSGALDPIMEKDRRDIKSSAYRRLLSWGTYNGGQWELTQGLHRHQICTFLLSSIGLYYRCSGAKPSFSLTHFAHANWARIWGPGSLCSFPIDHHYRVLGSRTLYMQFEWTFESLEGLAQIPLTPL